MRLFGPVLTLLFLLTFYSGLEAQKRCATVEYHSFNRAAGKILESDDQFERALADKIKTRRKNQAQRLLQDGPYKIPVVVHIIHNGEAVGTGRNISDAQVISQINVLNKDFSRQNADAGNTPAEFLSVAGSLDIEFVLARQDYLGHCTTGIVRVDGKRAQWSMSSESQFKALSYWPAEDYLNIWVLKHSDYLGYASFPVSSGLPGLEDAENNRLLDGVIVDYRVFGTTDAGPFELDQFYNKGRTTTHEVGHFLGLRHIWGDDDGCSESDYAADTPNQATETYRCNLTPASPVIHPRADVCTTMKMFQNYMDYTDDVCMNLFTQGQIERIVTVLGNSPRRLSLLTSHGLEEPSDQDLVDVEVTDVDFPSAITCSVDRGNKTPLIINLKKVTSSDITEIAYSISVNSKAATNHQAAVTFVNNEARLIITSLSGLVIGFNTISVTVSAPGCEPTPENNVITFEVNLLDRSCDPFILYIKSNGQAAITFDLPETVFSRISVVNLIGQEVARLDTQETTNQTIPFSVPGGAYVVRVQIGATSYVRKVYLHP